MLRTGTPPTIAAAAEAALVSRATAYRYFPANESLLLEAGNVASATESTEAMLETLESTDPEERLLTLFDHFQPIVVSEEISLRSALRTYLDVSLENRRRGRRAVPVREGRRMRWLDKVLEPVRGELSNPQFNRLRHALALTMSIDAVVVMKDVCRIESDKEALETLRWAATALLRAGLAERKRAPRRKSGRA